MKVYLLQERDGNKISTDIGTYDTYDGFVIRAKDEASARKLAMGEEFGTHAKDWMSVVIVSCTEITSEGKEEILLGSFRAG